MSDLSAPPPSTEQLRLVNDEIAPRPLPVWRYLAAGAIVSTASRGVVLWRALRALPALLGIALPVLALAAAARVAGQPPDAQVRAIASMSERVDGWLAVVPATTDVVLVILFGLLLIGVRGAFDALLYGRLRELASGVPRPPAERIRRGYVAHSGMALLSFGLYVGAVMFTSPIVRAMARVTAERAGSPEARTIAVVGVGIVFGAIAWVRILAVLASCWIAWRPRFMAATLVAALTEPIRRIRIYGAVLLGWLVGHGAAVGGAALSVNALVGPDGRLLEAIPPIAGITLGASAALGLAVTSWVECTLMLVVGHRLGEVDVTTARRARVTTPARSAAVVTDAGPGFVPPVRGAFVASSDAGPEPARSILSWDELGLAESAAHARWDAGSAASLGASSAMHATAAGSHELVIAAPPLAIAASPQAAPQTALAPPKAAVVTEPERSAPMPMSTQPEAVAEPAGPAPTPTAATSARVPLEGLGRARHRTAAGGVEVSWRPAPS